MSDTLHREVISPEPGPILVTGAAGFMGYHLMKELGMGDGDIAVDIDSDFEAPEGVSKIRWSLPSPPPPELGCVRYIIHLAAMSSVSKSLKEIHKVYEINLMGTISVLEYMVSKCPGAKMLLASSSEVYKSADDLISENCEIGPGNPYGATKAAAEIAAFQFARNYDLDIVVTRAFPHFGPGQSGNFALPSFCRRIINTLQNGDSIIRVGNLNPVRDYLYVTDVARAYRHILSRGQSGSVYNICSGTGISIADMVRILIDISGTDIELKTDPDLFRPVDVEFQVGDPSRLRSLTGWKPEVDRIEGLRKLFSWWEAII
ncbi:MAG: GDP-mannose 4,6-dehydratase [Candidatus Aegiribacteria sp.]|nr:GDP-mannose 4,6-dehydratase [Candidatus Aegiribacteria sp.]